MEVIIIVIIIVVVISPAIGFCCDDDFVLHLAFICGDDIALNREQGVEIGEDSLVGGLAVNEQCRCVGVEGMMGRCGC